MELFRKFILLCKAKFISDCLKTVCKNKIYKVNGGYEIVSCNDNDEVIFVVALNRCGGKDNIKARPYGDSTDSKLMMDIMRYIFVEFEDVHPAYLIASIYIIAFIFVILAVLFFAFIDEILIVTGAFIGMILFGGSSVLIVNNYTRCKNEATGGYEDVA